jgi:hypothetical protein
MEQPRFAQDVAELEFIVGNIDMFSLLLDELPALWASVRTISIESQEVTRDCTDADTADGGREDWEDWAPPEGEFWESLAQFTALTYVLFPFPPNSLRHSSFAKAGVLNLKPTLVARNSVTMGDASSSVDF